MHPAKTFVLFKFLSALAMGATTATYVPCLLRQGLTMADVVIVNIVFWVTIVLAEVPTGMLADGKSRAWSIKSGIGWAIAGALVYMTATNVGVAMLAEAIVGVGFAFVSGADQAWIVDALIARGESRTNREVFARAMIWHSCGVIVGGVLSACIGLIDLRAGWMACALINTATLLFLMRYMGDDGEPVVRLTERVALAESIAALRSSPALVWSVVALMVSGLFLSYNYFWAPLFRGRVGQAGLSVVWTLSYGALALAGHIVRTRGSWDHKEERGVVIGLFVAGVGLVGAGLCTGVIPALAFVVLHELGRGMAQSLFTLYTQHRVKSGYRATFGSLQSLLGRIGYIVVLIALWLYTRGLPTSESAMMRVWAMSGVALVVATAMLWLWRAKE